MESALETAEPLVNAKRHRVQLELPTQEIELEVDPVRLTQVLGNLITNAAKYTDPEGQITVAAQIDAHQLAIRIRNTGIGLPAHMLSKVFDMFSQVDPTGRHSEGGTRNRTRSRPGTRRSTWRSHRGAQRGSGSG